MANTLTITVAAIDQVLASFDTIRVKKSTTGVDGTYYLITDTTPKPAQLTPPTPGPWNVVSKTLQLKLDSNPQVNIIFTGVDPLSAAQLVPQINTAMGETIATEVGGALYLTSNLTGTASKMEIVDGEAAAVFGWSDGDRDVGEEAHIQLVAGQQIYSFTDDDGAAGDYYKVQYFNTSNGLESQDSLPFQGAASTVLDASRLSIAKVNLIDGAGIAIPNFDISFYVVHEPFSVDGFEVGLARAPKTITTNNIGHAEIALVRGVKVKVVFEGTSVIREIVVPDQAEFNLLDVLSTSPDPFRVAEVDFPTAPRRSI